MTVTPEDLSFPVCTGGQLTIHSIGIFTEASGGTLVLSLPVASYITLGAGNTMRIAAGQVSVGFDGRPDMTLNEALSRAGNAENLISTLINRL